MASAWENILTRGIDAAERIVTTRLQVQSGVPNSSTADGIPVPAGEGAFPRVAGAFAGVPPFVWLGALALVGVALWRR
jgi:hypothetical protein